VEENWTSEQIQEWLEKECKYNKEIVGKFAFVTGTDLLNYSEDNLIKIAGNAIGLALYNFLHPKTGDVKMQNDIVDRLSYLEELVAKNLRTHTPGTQTNTEFGNEIRKKWTIVNFESFNIPPHSAPVAYWKETDLPDEDAPEAAFQKKISQSLAQFTFTYLRFLDTHAIGYLDSKKPDLSFFNKESKENLAVYAVVLGEIKTPKSLADVATTGEIATLAHRLLAHVPNPTFCYYFLTDGTDITFLKITFRENGEYEYTATHYYNYSEIGYKYLFYLLNSSLDVLGWSIPTFTDKNGTPHFVANKISSGKTSTTWRTTSGVVIKSYYSAYLESKNTEVQILKKLSNIPSIPILEAEGENFIVITPFGTKFENFENSHQLTKFLQMLKKVHDVGIIHRDIRPSNLIIKDNLVYLIDWGFAVEKDKPEIYKGTLWCAANEILTSKTNSIASKPQHDLIMFVKMYYARYNRRLESLISRDFNLNQQNGREQCAKFWDTQCTGSNWVALLKACENEDYDEISTMLSFFLLKINDE